MLAAEPRNLAGLRLPGGPQCEKYYMDYRFSQVFFENSFRNSIVFGGGHATGLPWSMVARGLKIANKCVHGSGRSCQYP